jgi:Fe-S cluster assembly iron-binding protein IscA
MARSSGLPTVLDSLEGFASEGWRIMLQLTETAATRITEVRRDQGLPETFGVRVSGAATPDGKVALQVAFSEGPVEGDQIDEQHGTRVFVAPEVAEPLEEVELDVEGEAAEGVQLILRPQGED